jgi:hypothetical protein
MQKLLARVRKREKLRMYVIRREIARIYLILTVAFFLQTILLILGLRHIDNNLAEASSRAVNMIKTAGDSFQGLANDIRAAIKEETKKTVRQPASKPKKYRTPRTGEEIG